MRIFYNPEEVYEILSCVQSMTSEEKSNFRREFLIAKGLSESYFQMMDRAIAILDGNNN